LRVTEAQLPQQQAPFIPSSPDEEAIPAKPGQVFRVPGFPRLFGAQVVSSIGDWTGVVAIIALAGNISTNAVGLVMVARMLPGVFLAPIGGALIDRWNRKVVMVTADIGRAGLLVALPFFDNMLGLVVISFCIEVLTLLWGPAKDATVPNIVKEPDQLAAANSLNMFAAYGTFPIGSILFALMAAVSSWVSNFSAVSPFRPEQASLAIWVDAITFLVSALLISGLHIPKGGAKAREKQTVGDTWRDVAEGLRFIRSAPLVRGVMIGLAGGLIGGGSIIPLGAVFTTEVLQSTPSAYGFLVTSLGVGAAAGVVTLLFVQRRLPRVQVFVWGVVLAGIAIGVMAWVTTLAFAIVLVALVGAGAGCAYVTGFTLLQESVSDEMRGRTFATLYTVVRVCLLLSLTIGPFVAGGLDTLADKLTDGTVDIGSATLTIKGVQLTLFLGGVITVGAGFAARRRMRKAQEDLSVL
jgi:dTMP kinase